MQKIRIQDQPDRFNYNNYERFMKDPLGHERRFQDAKTSN